METTALEGGWGWLELSYTDWHNGLVAALVSVTTDGQHSLRSMLNWVHGSNREGWLWRADANYNTLLGILNTDTQEAKVEVSLDYYDNGLRRSYDLPELTLPPRASELVNIGTVIAEQQPDDDGDVIPATATTGGYRVRKVNAPLTKSVMTEALVFDRQRKSFTTFYNTCCAYNFFTMLPTSVSGIPGDTRDFTTSAINSCTNFPENLTFASAYTSNNHPVANFTAPARITLFNPGTATATASIQYDRPRPAGGNTYIDPCFSVTVSDSSSVTVKPSVQFTGGNNFIFVGTDPTVKAFNLQQAQGNPSGGTYSWSASPTNRVSSFENLSPPGLVRLTGNAPSTSLLDTTLTVNYTLDGQSATPANKNLTVRIFKFLQQSGQIQVIPINGPPTFGYEATVFYNIFTNPAGQQVPSGFSGMTVVEVVNTISITVNGEPAEIPIELTTSTGATDANSQIIDRLRLTRPNEPLPSGLDITMTQDLAVGGIFVRNNTIHMLTNTVTVTNNGPFS